MIFAEKTSVADHLAHGCTGGGLVDEVLAGGEGGGEGLEGERGG
jgi:hypothetical protein